jgi:hypothetical protein
MRWWHWWPVLLGAIVTPFAVRTVEIMVLTGPWGARLLMPWTFLLAGHMFGMADMANRLLMYGQFPIYGALLVLLTRKLSWVTAIAIVIVLHLCGVGLVALAANS